MQRLLKIGEALENLPPGQRDIDSEVTLARATVVMLAGHLEAFLNSLIREIVGLLPNNWEQVSLGQKKYVATCVFLEINDYNQYYKVDDFIDEKKIDDFKSSVVKIRDWFQDPSSIGATREHAIKGFYKGVPPKVIDNMFKRFHKENKSFLVWLDERGRNKSRIYTVLEQLVNQRSEIAHGELATKPTLADARLYVLTATNIVRLVDEFMRDAYKPPTPRSSP